ncbi:hypothetical protein ACH3XW_5765 [Acanthocheilonema viteae]
MWQQAVVTCALILFKINNYLVQSADYNAKGNNETFSNRTANESSINFTNSTNSTTMMVSDTKNSSITPMGTMLILMGVTTILTITVAYTLAIYSTEKRLFVERQIAMQMVSTG